MAAFDFPDVDKLFTGTDLDPVVAQREFVAFAQREVDALIQSGRASSTYSTYINGQRGPLQNVVLPGPAVFVFSNWVVAIEAALEILRRLSESKGKYANSFLVTVNGVRVTEYAAIAPGSEVIIINAQPNTSGKRHFERSKGQFNRRFMGVFKASTTFVNAKAGLDPLIPYILRRGNGRRKGSQVGQPITYPALEIEPVL
jgi:hypothetical protein